MPHAGHTFPARSPVPIGLPVISATAASFSRRPAAQKRSSAEVAPR